MEDALIKAVAAALDVHDAGVMRLFRSLPPAVRRRVFRLHLEKYRAEGEGSGTSRPAGGGD